MKTLITIILYTVISGSLLFSCSQTSENSQYISKEIISESKIKSNNYGILDTLPEKVQRKRNASIILSEFVKVENNQYILDISKDEAKNLGVSPELYNEIKEEIAFTNNWITRRNSTRLSMRGGSLFRWRYLSQLHKVRFHGPYRQFVFLKCMSPPQVSASQLKNHKN